MRRFWRSGAKWDIALFNYYEIVYLLFAGDCDNGNSSARRSHFQQMRAQAGYTIYFIMHVFNV